MSYHQQIYDRLRRGGFTEAAALAMLGNWKQESGCEPYRLQGDFSSNRYLSKVYTERVENGSISRQEFGSDQKGYGLAQWTYVNYPYNTKGRKFDLYDFWKKSGVALDNLGMQVDFCLWELTYTNYAGIMPDLRTGTDLWALTELICTRYEQPAVNNISTRYNCALEIKSQIDLNTWQDGETDIVVPDEPQKMSFWNPHRQICEGMEGADVSVLKAILNALDYYEYTEGDNVDYFNRELTTAVKAFQRSKNLAVDGIAGKMTWTALDVKWG